MLSSAMYNTFRKLFSNKLSLSYKEKTEKNLVTPPDKISSLTLSQ